MTKTTQKEQEQPKRTLYWMALAAALIVFGVSAFTAHGGKAAGWEAGLFHAINGWPNGLRMPFVMLTFFGSTWMALIVVIGTFATKAYRLAYRLAVTIVGAYAVAYLAKHFIDRARPEESLMGTGVHTRVLESGMGFPSGHATVSTVLALSILPYLPRWVRWVGVPVFIGLVCLSRLYLGVHLPLDIIGGVAIGTGAVCFIEILPRTVLVAFRLVQK